MTDYDRYEQACVYAGNRVLGHPISAVQLVQICTLIVHHCRCILSPMNADSPESACPAFVQVSAKSHFSQYAEGMKLSDMTARELRKSLKAVEKTLGAEATTAKILRRELNRRHNQSKPTRATVLSRSEASHA
jgi:hypothetical protein